MIPYELHGTIRLGLYDSRGWLARQRPVRTVHPAALSVRELIPGWAYTTVVCPHCPLNGDVVTVLDHLLGEHDTGLEVAAEWLETVDGDLFALAVHYLMSEARTDLTLSPRCS